MHHFWKRYQNITSPLPPRPTRDLWEIKAHRNRHWSDQKSVRITKANVQNINNGKCMNKEWNKYRFWHLKINNIIYNTISIMLGVWRRPSIKSVLVCCNGTDLQNKLLPWRRTNYKDFQIFFFFFNYLYFSH